MHVLIAGCGWLGREVARRLVRRGDRVTAIVASERSASTLRAGGLDARALDLAVRGAGSVLPHDCDGVVAACSAAAHDVAAYRRAYVDATRSLLESRAAIEARLVYVGSTGVFGQADGSWVDEATAPAPADVTAEVLVEAERLVLDASRHAARPAVVRCSGLYGPGRAGTIGRVRSGALAGGDGDGPWMNFCHRDDAAATVIAALDRGRPGAVYHASDAHPATRR
jgi:nucleoside-diphosphate-sugar epimerase